MDLDQFRVKYYTQQNSS